MSDPTAALYVRLPHTEFEKLDRAAAALATNKKALVTTLVSHYVDPDTARRMQDEVAPLAQEISVEGAKAGDRASRLNPRR